jgi:hypothetical protein
MRDFILVLVAVPQLAGAQPAWSLDASLAGTGSFEVDPHPPHDQPGVVPAMLFRVQRRVGSVFVGGTFTGGIPAWYGEVGLALSADVERVMRPAVCADGACVPSVALGAGADVGASYYFYDSESLEYWGPLARMRGELRVMWECPNEACPEGHNTAFGLVVGASAAVTSAHYVGGGVQARIEPGIEIGLALRL